MDLCFLFLLHWVLVAAHRFPLVVTGRLLYGRHIDSRALGLSSCRAWAQLPRGKWDPSSPTRDQTHVPCIGSWVLNHWTTREILIYLFLVTQMTQENKLYKKAKVQKSNRVESHFSKHCCSFIQEIWVSSPFTYYFHNSRFISLCTKMLYPVCCCDSRTII